MSVRTATAYTVKCQDCMELKEKTFENNLQPAIEYADEHLSYCEVGEGFKNYNHTVTITSCILVENDR